MFLDTVVKPRYDAKSVFSFEDKINITEKMLALSDNVKINRRSFIWKRAGI